ANGDLFGNRDRQFVDAVEAGPEKRSAPLILIAPELFVIDQLASRLEQRVDLRRAMVGGEAFAGIRQQLAQTDRVLANLASGRMSREIDRNSRALVEGEQLVQVVSQEHGRPQCKASPVPTRKSGGLFRGRTLTISLGRL